MTDPFPGAAASGLRSGSGWAPERAKFNIEYKRLFGAAHGNAHVAQEKQADVLVLVIARPGPWRGGGLRPLLLG